MFNLKLFSLSNWLLFIFPNNKINLNKHVNCRSEHHSAILSCIPSPTFRSVPIRKPRFGNRTFDRGAVFLIESCDFRLKILGSDFQLVVMFRSDFRSGPPLDFYSNFWSDLFQFHIGNFRSEPFSYFWTVIWIAVLFYLMTHLSYFLSETL